jgi:glycosyltransferase involved in cell wall biosynthesis
MKIGIDARLALTNNRGHGSYLRGLIKALLQIDQENEYILYVDTKKPSSFSLNSNNAEYIYLRSTDYITWEQVTFPKRLHKDKVDLVLLSNHTAPIICPIPSVVTIMDMLFSAPISLDQPLYQTVGRMYKRLCMSRAANYAQRILTISEYSKQQIVNRLGVPSSKIAVTYLSTTTNFQQLSIEDSTQTLYKYGLLPKNYIFCLGATDPRKNTLGVLLAYIRLKQQGKPNIQLVIAGMSREELQRFWTKRGHGNLPGEVTCTGFVTDEELVALYSQASIFVYPSLGEGFGLPVLEAFACGTPVITSITTSIPEVAGEAAILIDPSSEDELVRAMMELKANVRLQEEYRRKGIERARQFSWQTTAKRTLSVFYSAISDINERTIIRC